MRRRSVYAAAIVSVLIMLSLAGTAAAAPGVVQDLPGCRANQLDRNDDGSTDAVPLGFTAHMFDTTFDQVYVNNNGNVSARDPLSDFTPFDFRETGQTIIAPFFADVDTRGSGSGLVQYGPVTGGYGGRPAFCVIWDNVGYYSSHDDKRNTFQLILVDQGTAGVDVVFNYDNIVWETGDASDGTNGFGGTSAAAGYASGDGDSAHALMLPGSFAIGGLLDSNAATGLAGHATAGQPAGRYVFQLREGAATGGRMTGLVTTPADVPAEGSPVQICADGGACVTRVTGSDGRYTASNLPAGTYTVTAFPGADEPAGSVTHENVPVGGPGTERTEDLQLAPPPPPPPDGTTITSIDTTPDGLPVAYWGDPLQLTTQGCPGGTATYSVAIGGHVVRTGSLTESPAGTYTATIAPLAPNHGDGEVTIHVSCPGGTSEDVDFGIYVDPSGVVRDTAGNPVAGAVVTLERSATPDGPFFPVPDGSSLMSPGNRTNPDTSRSDGRFGWDVVAGYYVVTASKQGCRSATTPVLTIPPPVTNLDLRLDCTPPAPHPTPTPVHTTPPPSTNPAQTVPVPTAKAPKRIGIGAVKLHGRQLRVKITCLKTAKKACSGLLTATIGKKVVAKKRYKHLGRGKSVTLKAPLTAKGRALVAKVKKGHKVALHVTCTVKDAGGKGATAKRTVSIRR